MSIVGYETRSTYGVCAYMWTLTLHLQLQATNFLSSRCSLYHLGQRARDVQLLGRGKRVSAIAMMTARGVLDVHCTTDGVDEDVFCDAIERKLLPHLMPFDGINPQSVVILDNCSIHHTRCAVDLIQSTGALVHFLPPYSPDLSPVEELFSKVKSCLRQNDRATELSDDRTLLDFVYAAFTTVTPDDCFGWFEDCGYV